MLESGGFGIVAYASLAAAFESPAILDAGCAVVDEEAIGDRQRAHALFRRFARPIILLVSVFHETPDAPGVKNLTKPLLGESLLDAVRHAVGETDPDT
jgi:hypothetical protein